MGSTRHRDGPQSAACLLVEAILPVATNRSLPWRYLGRDCRSTQLAADIGAVDGPLWMMAGGSWKNFVRSARHHGVYAVAHRSAVHHR